MFAIQEVKCNSAEIHSRGGKKNLHKAGLYKGDWKNTGYIGDTAMWVKMVFLNETKIELFVLHVKSSVGQKTYTRYKPKHYHHVVIHRVGSIMLRE